MSSLRLRGLFLAAVATALVLPVASAAPAVPVAGDDLSAQASTSTFPLADPDTVLAKDGSYITYGTTRPPTGTGT